MFASKGPNVKPFESLQSRLFELRLAGREMNRVYLATIKIDPLHAL